MSIELLEKPKAIISETDSIPSSWEVSKLSDICLVNPSGGFDLSDNTPVTFLPMPAVEELTGKIDVSISRLYGEVKKGYTRFQEKDVLFAKITPCMENGKVAIAKGLMNGFGCGSTEFHVLRPHSGIDEEFVRYYVVQDKFRNNAQSNMSGTAGQKRVPSDFMKNAEIPVPPTNEQKRIVSKIGELFSQLDDGEAALKRAQKLVEQYRQSVLKAAVTGELTKDWREKNKGKIESGEVLLQRLLNARRNAWEQAELAKLQAKGKASKDDNWKKKYPEPQMPNTTNLSELPESWAWVSVEQLCIVVEYGSSAKCSSDSSGVPVLRMGNIVNGELDLEDLKYLPKKHNEFPQLLLEYGDLLFNRTNSAELVGKTAVYKGKPAQASFASYLIRFRPVLGFSEYVSYYINSAFGRSWIASVKSQQVGQANVNGTKLKNLIIPVPSLKEQDEIIQIVEREFSQSSKLKEWLGTELDRSKCLKQTILKSAFSGQLVPQDPNDEPASELLKRIAQEQAALTEQQPKRKVRKAKKG